MWWLLSIFSLVGLSCASSPYDRDWLERALTEATGHAPGQERVAVASLPPGVTQVGALSADDAVATALWNNARFQAELTRLGFSRADLAEAGALPNPIFAFLLPIGPRQLEASLTYPVSALLQRPYRVAAAKLDVERTARTLVEVALDLVRDVRVAHGEVALADRRLVVRGELERTWSTIADLTEARQHAGDASEIEARSARAETRIAADFTARAQIDIAIAEDRLRRLLGLTGSPLGEPVAVVTTPADVRAPPPPAELVHTALAARPDLRAAELAVEAAGERLGWERAKILQLFARLDLKPVGTQGGPPSLLLPGAQLEVPIFNWNPGGRGRAEAEMAQAAFRYVAARIDIETEVRVARGQLDQAIGSLVRFREEVLPPLEANVISATRAYEHGAETYLLVLDAARRSQEAKLRELDIEIDLLRSRAALERAVGRRLL